MNRKMIEVVHKKTHAQMFTAAWSAMTAIKNPSIGKWPSNGAYSHERIIFLT